MSLLCAFIVQGDPVGKGRPRFTRQGHAFTPHKTATAESVVAMSARLEYGLREPTKKPVTIQIEARFAVPSSASNKKRLFLLGQACTKRPDADNVAKLVCDALNGVIWKDDAQICGLEVWKTWAEHGSLIVRVFEESIDDDATNV